MMTVRRNQTTVTHNVSWFKQAHRNPGRPEDTNTPESDTSVQYPGIDSPSRSDPESDPGQAVSSAQSGSLPTMTLPNNSSIEVIPSGESTCCSQWYSLRPNPAPSKRFKDYVRKKKGLKIL